MAEIASRSVRWLHVSDFHTGKDDYGQQKLFKEILRHVEERCQTGGSPNLVFITGDIAQSGEGDQYAMFCDEFYYPLVEILGQGAEERVFAVPGNHDVDRSQAKFVRRDSIRSLSPRFLDPTPEGRKERAAILPRFSEYQSWGISASGSDWIDSSTACYTARRSVAGIEIGIVGTNTAWHAEGDNDERELEIGVAAVEDALEALGSCTLRVVLAHHPINWLEHGEANQLRTVLGKHRALYLHGHLHKNASFVDEGAGRPFRTLQAGAAFQARDDERWRNRILWCDFIEAEDCIRAEPLSWNQKGREWRIDGDAFPEVFRPQGSSRWVFPRPRLQTALGRGQAAGPRVPDGWTLLGREALEELRPEPGDDQIIRFFDGRVPDWALALSSRVPRRGVVGDLVRELSDEDGEETKAKVALLLGAGGEGKSTAVMQAAAQAVEEGVADSILWRSDPSATLPTNLIASLPGGPAIILADDAESLAADLFDFLKSGLRHRKKGLCFLLCARDTDWMSVRAERHDWQSVARFGKHVLRGMSLADAEAIVDAWASFGSNGLGELSEVPRVEAAQKLLEAATNDSSREEGSFLGAMLRTRIGDSLEKHIASLLERLSRRSASGAATLLDAFARICFVHAEGLELLTDELLEWALGIKTNEFRRRVLAPLGDEAAATSYAGLVVTRHRAIADVAARLLVEIHHYDRPGMFEELVTLADSSHAEGRHVRKLREWQYLSDHFADKNEFDLALRLARSLARQNPENPFFATKAAQISRRSGEAVDAAKALQDAVGRVDLRRETLRSFLHEWSTCNGYAGNHAVAACLAAQGVADLDGTPLLVEQAGMSLHRLAISFAELASNADLERLSEACFHAASASMKLRPGVELPALVTTVCDGYAAARWDRRRTGQILFDAVEVAWERREVDVQLPEQAMGELSFDALARLIE